MIGCCKIVIGALFKWICTIYEIKTGLSKTIILPGYLQDSIYSISNYTDLDTTFTYINMPLNETHLCHPHTLS
jgi:hypothetical protein